MKNNQSINLQNSNAITKSYLHPRPKYYDFSYKKPFPSQKNTDELLKEGYIGVDIKLVDDNAFAAVAYKFKDRIRWTVSNQLEERVWLMTTDREALNRLSDFMLKKFSWCPMIYRTPPQEKFIFTPKNDTEQAAIEATVSGEYGWQGSLYSLELYEYQDNEAGFIFATKPLNSCRQEWLLVKLNFKDYTGSWSYHDTSLEQVYYIWKENIKLAEPNYHPTSDEILDAIKD